MRILTLLLAMLLLATFAPPSLQRNPPIPKTSLLRFEPIPLDEKSPGRVRVGALRFLGGWAVTSNDYRFGGLSALHAEEGQALALSDAGWSFRFALPARPGRAPVAVGWLAEGPGDKGEDKKNRDAESLAVAGTRAWIGFEQANAVWRYRRRDWRAEASVAPPAMAKWDENGGSEAMVRLADGRFLVFAEGSGGESEAMLFDRDPAGAGARSVPFRYRPPQGYRLTDAAMLPDGRLLLLNRRLQILKGFSAKLTIASAPAIWAGAVLAGKEIAAFEGPLGQGNLEALSVVQEGGRTILWLASDDNYNPLQRTVILKFALEERP